MDEIQKHTNNKENFEYLKLSHDYAWNWYQYHANQRMVVFRFYFIIIAVLMAFYIKSIEINLFYFALASSVLIIVISGLFWRWDIRSMDFVKIAEDYLEQSELILSEHIKINQILLVKSANDKNTMTAKKYKSNFLYSFREVIWTIYTIVGILGLGGALLAGYQMLVQ